ncbi:hypothetical protein [Streptomyces sp. NPDC048496]|uniref:hypothetical protein n=1 Tax=Streptomyces sp. NPDC048496 TaxID=3365558 RepID=UPI0037197AFF
MARGESVAVPRQYGGSSEQRGCAWAQRAVKPSGVPPGPGNQPSWTENSETSAMALTNEGVAVATHGQPSGS